MITGDEVTPRSDATSSPVSRTAPILPRVIAWATVLFVLSMVAVRWDERTGFTSLLRFGEEYRDRRIPEVAALPLADKPNRGYDGQFYGQMAVAGDVTDRSLHEALDNPGYRLRRVLLPALAHLLGGGDAWRTLHIYAGINVLAWLLACGLLWRIIDPVDLRGTAVWLGCMLGLGTLDSVRMALTDLPAVLLTLVAIDLARRRRPRTAAGLLAVTALARETAVFSVAALDLRPWGDRASWKAHVVHGVIVATPVFLLAAWLYGRVSGVDPLGRANFDWPGFAIAEHGMRWAGAIAAGDLDSRHLFGLIAIASFSWQSVSILRQWNAPSPWVRMALPFAVLFWVLGDAVWNGYWAVARACLPLTFAYNLTLPRDRSFAWRWILGNVCLLHAIWRFLPE